jgi:hypothetical protein
LPFEIKENIWNFAVIENLNMLFKEEFLTNNNLKTFQEPAKPVLSIFTFDKQQPVNHDTTKILIENLNL